MQIPNLTMAKGCLENLLSEERPLVRFRGMVQSNGREVYCKELPNHRLGGWGFSEGKEDRIDEGMDVHAYNSLLDDRTTIWAVSVPGEASWISETEVSLCRVVQKYHLNERELVGMFGRRCERPNLPLSHFV